LRRSDDPHGLQRRVSLRDYEDEVGAPEPVPQAGSIRAGVVFPATGSVMIRRSLSRLLLIASVVSAGPKAVFAAEETAGCTLEQVELSPDTVIEPCSKIIAEKTTSPADRGYALFIRGKGYHNTKRLDLARQDYDDAIVLTPTNEELFVSRANIANRAGRFQEGVSFLQKALALNPSNGHALRTMGALLDDSGHSEDANRYFSLALAADAKDAYALLFRSKNYARQRRFDEALKDADDLMAIPPAAINRQGYLDGRGDHVDFHIVALEKRAAIYDALGQFDRAEQDLNAAVAYSRSAPSLSARGKFLAYKTGREKEALSDLDEAIALGSLDSDAYYAKGVLLLGFRKYQDALAALDGAVKIDPWFSSALGMRAKLHRELDQTDLAVADMTQAVARCMETGCTAALQGTMSAMRSAGYWRSSDNPTDLTPALEDAIRACMLDKHCN
jgi:tetratricopeptide (TPR) repeat protein